MEVSVLSHGSEERVHEVQEEFEDTKGVIRIRISKKNRKHSMIAL
jgi:hypothetical protein